MEQKKIEQITLHLIVFGTIIIISVLARQTVLHYGWDEFSSYLILIVCSIVIGGKSSVSCPLKPSDSAPLKQSTMPP